MLSACIGGTDSAEPSGKDVIIAKKDTPFTSLVLFGAPEETSKAAAISFKTAFNESGIGNVNAVLSSSLISDSSEIIFGESDREASIRAKALFEQGKTDFFSWAFCYYDGKLAIYSDSETAYSFAIKDFFNLYCDGESITVKDNLAECHSITEEEYDKYLEELDYATADAKRAENAKLIPALLNDLSAQRSALASNKLFDVSTATADMMALVKNNAWGTAPAEPIDEHPRVMFNKDDIEGIRRALRDDTHTNRYFSILLKTEYDGILTPAPEYVNGSTVETHNYSAVGLERIMAKALAYQVYEDPYYGYQAIYAMKNYLATLEIKYITLDQYREFGDVGFTLACVYDWCYDLLTDDDKNQLIAAAENVIFDGSNASGAYFEVGFPPTKQSSVVGHGAEYQILRDYLSFAIAIYDENPTWYQYIGARFYNDFVPSRNYYFENTGLASQGTSYLTVRHLANLFSAWLSAAGMNYNPYVNLQATVRSFAAYEYAPGYIFTDGDGKSVQTTLNLRDAEFMAGYLYGDPTLIALAEKTLGRGCIEHGMQGLGCTTYVIIRGKGTEPADDPYSDMELIQYNGSPLGQYVVHERWNTTDSATVFMKLKERHTANHEHGDAGSFQIYYKGMLTSDGGLYDDYNHTHTQKFYKESVAHNTLLISDNTNTSRYYTGSQRNYGAPTTHAQWMSGDYEAGKITGREHAYTSEDKTSPLYAYLAGEITASYSSSTVSYVGRRMLTVYTGNEDFPMAFFVYDDVTAKSADYKKTFLLQITSRDDPTINTYDKTVATENGDGRLVLTCLTDGVTIEGLGGRVYDANGQYNSAKSSNYLINGKQIVSLSGGDDGHWGRIEISLSGKADHTFMNVIYVTDAGRSENAPAIERIEDDSVEGATFGNVAALFVKSRERIKTDFSATVNGSEDMSYYVSGVAAGKWNVYVDRSFIGVFEATEEGGLLTFDAPAGRVIITPAK